LPVRERNGQDFFRIYRWLVRNAPETSPEPEYEEERAGRKSIKCYSKANNLSTRRLMKKNGGHIFLLLPVKCIPHLVIVVFATEPRQGFWHPDGRRW